MKAKETTSIEISGKKKITNWQIDTDICFLDKNDQLQVLREVRTIMTSGGVTKEKNSVSLFEEADMLNIKDDARKKLVLK